MTVLGIDPRVLCKLGKHLPLHHILSLVLNFWNWEAEGKPTWWACAHSERNQIPHQKEQEKGNGRYVFQCFIFNHTDCTYLYVWCFDTTNNLWRAERKELCGLWTPTQMEHPPGNGFMKGISDEEKSGELTPWRTTKQGLPTHRKGARWSLRREVGRKIRGNKTGFPLMFQLLSYVWHHSLMPFQVDIR